MAQFDVHRNSGLNRSAIPYVVIVQSSIFKDYRRRVVIPLVKKSYLDAVTVPRFNPTFEIEDTRVVLHPLEIVSVDVRKLGEFVISIGGAGQQIIDALDELITREQPLTHRAVVASRLTAIASDSRIDVRYRTEAR